MGALANVLQFARSPRESISHLFRSTPAPGQVSGSGSSSSLFQEQAVQRMLFSFHHIADPDEVLRKNGMGREALRSVASDDEISGAIDTRREAVIATSWRLEGASDSQQELVDWVWALLEPKFESVVRSTLEAVWYGYSVQEAVYKRSPDGRIVWSEITEKPLQWFIPQLDGTVLYRSITQPQGEEVDARKFFLTQRNPTYLNPYGEALFSRLWWPWFFRQQGWAYWVKWLERFGTPLLIGKGANPAEIAEQLQLAVQDAAVGVPIGSDVQIAGATTGTGHFKDFDETICKRFQKLILGQTLTTDVVGKGSYAAAKVHDDVRQVKRDADIRLVTKTVQRIIDVLWQLNQFEGAPPEFVMADETGLEVERANRDLVLYQAGVRFTTEYLFRAYDFEENDITVAPEPDPNAQPSGAPGNGVGNPAAKDAKPGKFSATLFSKPGQHTLFSGGKTRFTADQQVIEDELAKLLPTVKSPINEQLMREAILASSSPRDLADRLAVLLEGHSLEEFSSKLSQALFAADILGYAHADRKA